MIRLVCECGKQFQAREEDAGKLVVCPSCNRQLTASVDGPSQERVQRERPILRDESESGAQEMDKRSRSEAAANSGKAIASLILGVLSLLCNLLTGLPALILAILALRDIGQSRGRLSGQGLAIAGIVTACVCTLLSCVTFVPISVALLLPAVQKVHESATRLQSLSNLHNLGIALHMYNDVYDTLPSAGFSKPDKPAVKKRSLLSWRVAILPFLNDQKALYDRFKLDEPWDSPNNIKLLEQMPAIYKNPRDNNTPPGHTRYQVFVGNGAAFEMTKGYNLPADFPDGLAITILIVEAEKPVPWTKPEDIDFDPNKPMLPVMSGLLRSGFQVLMADGSVHTIVPQVSENTLKAAITRNNRDALGPDWQER